MEADIEVMWTSEGTPRITGNEEAKKGQGRILPQSLQREHGPADTLVSDF